jgi:hypothetical protein
MPTKAKKIEEAPIQEQAEVQETPDTPAKAAYRALIAQYKEQNPVKYEQKRKEFERKLKGDIELKTDKMNKRKTFVVSNLPPIE